MSEIRQYRPGRSSGPKSPNGKANSSRNSLKHGCCSNILILPGETEEDLNDLKQAWLDDYEPSHHVSRTLVLEVALAHWFLIRARRRYSEAEHSVYDEQEDPMQWTEEQHQKIERFTRYRTTAERAFTRALNNLEALRKHRVRERVLAQRHSGAGPRPAAASQAASTSQKPEPPKSPAGQLFQGQNAKKNQRKIPVLDQWVEITIEDGITCTKLFPSNAGLIEEGKAMDPPPELVYRRLNFVNGVPPEYDWTGADPDVRIRGGCGIQRMDVNTWLEVIEQEKNSGAGHIGPCRGNLPRPKERGGCDCPVCTQNKTLLEKLS
jgi:hypothetical protein